MMASGPPPPRAKVREAIPALRISLVDIDLLPGERWWGGAVADGTAMPFGTSVHRRDLNENAGFLEDPTNGANQAAPLLVSDRGRYVWSDWPFVFEFAPGHLAVRGRDVLLDGGDEPTLAAGFRAAAAAHFPPSGRTPALPMFTGPQYNTWMEMPYAPTQVRVLDYVAGLLSAGFPPGVVMIDDRWSRGLRNLALRPSRLPRSRGHGCAAARLGLSGDAVARTVRQSGQPDVPRSATA